jgi:hypothetical protein
MFLVTRVMAFDGIPTSVHKRCDTFDGAVQLFNEWVMAPETVWAELSRFTADDGLQCRKFHRAKPTRIIVTAMDGSKYDCSGTRGPWCGYCQSVECPLTPENTKVYLKQ